MPVLLILPNLISDLSLILVTAALAVLLFRWLKQPLVLGYLVAGFLAGTKFDFFPTVSDIESVKVWAEIGIIFLLFSLGLEFSFKKLIKVGGTASITAGFQIIFMCFIGYFVGYFLGLNTLNSFFLGVMLSISSTTIIAKSFEELEVKSQKFAQNVMGALIVQDIIAIVLMVVLSTVAATQQFSGSELFFVILKLFFFLTIWFVVGIFLIPSLLKKLKPLLTDEMVLIIAIALCLVMVIFAANVGFSPALGAFIMGSILAETSQAEHIEHLVKPVKDLFGAIFFVSVGMLIDPNALLQYAVPVLVLTLVVIFGQSISSTLGSLVSGQPLKSSIQTGMSLSQIGEFSFIIASLGLTLGVLESYLYPIIVAVSAITTFTTPYFIKWSSPFSVFLEKKLPRKWGKAIDRYSANSELIKAKSDWQIVLKSNSIQVLIHSTVIIALILLASNYLLPLVSKYAWGNFIAAVLTTFLVSPFLWALSLKKVAKKATDALVSQKKYRSPILMLALLRIAFALFYFGFILNTFFSPLIAFLALLVCVMLYFIFPKQLNIAYHAIEKHFISNFNQRSEKENKRQIILAPWDGHMASFTIAKTSKLVGKPLESLQLREQFGINIASIKRGDYTIPIPVRTEQLFPGDVITIISTDAQAKTFETFLKANEIPNEMIIESNLILQPLELKSNACIGKTIRASNIREHTHGIVVGVERNGQRILNPASEFILQEDDVLWIAGNEKKIKEFLDTK